LGEGHIFQGESYSSYYQLEKVMNIPRKTIQYRHETIGIPLDDVPSFQPKPPLERLGEKRYFPKKQHKNSANNEELNRIIEYPKAPDFIECSDEYEAEVEQEYQSWLMNAPVTLVKRELRITEKKKQALLDHEEKMGSLLFDPESHEQSKNRADKASEMIQQIIEEKGSEE